MSDDRDEKNYPGSERFASPFRIIVGEDVVYDPDADEEADGKKKTGDAADRLKQFVAGKRKGATDRRR